MKIGYLAAFLGLLLYQGVASAEMISGTVMNVDASGQKVTVLRADNRQSVTLHVQDASQLASLQTGSQVNLDANRSSLGTWEVTSAGTSSPTSGRAITTPVESTTGGSVKAQGNLGAFGSGGTPRSATGSSSAGASTSAPSSSGSAGSSGSSGSTGVSGTGSTNASAGAGTSSNR